MYGEDIERIIEVETLFDDIDREIADATVPVDAPEFKYTRIRVPGEAEIDLNVRIDANALLSEIICDD